MGEEGKTEEEKKEEREKKEEKKKVEEETEEEEVTQEEEEKIILLKVDMHCEACARKVARALKGFQGVEEVRAEYKASKVIVKGKKADPIMVRDRIQKKSGRKVELISPLPNPSSPHHHNINIINNNNNNNNSKEEENKEPTLPPPTQENKEQQTPAIITVILNIKMHCEACAQVLEKRIRKIKGVETVKTDVGKNEVVVEGSIVDPEKLVKDVYKRTRKQASIVKEVQEGKKKEEEKEDEANKEEEEGEEDKKTSSEIMKNEYYTEYSNNNNNYNDNYPLPPPPQFFSDENPNACSLM